VLLVTGDEVAFAVDFEEVEGCDDGGLGVEEVGLDEELELDGVDIADTVTEDNETVVRGDGDDSGLTRGGDVGDELGILDSVHKNHVAIGSSNNILVVLGERKSTDDHTGCLVFSLLLDLSVILELLRNCRESVLELCCLGSNNNILRNLECGECFSRRVINEKVGCGCISVIERDNTHQTVGSNSEHLENANYDMR